MNSDRDDLYGQGLDTLNDRLLEIRELLVGMIALIEQSTILLEEDIRGRNPDAYERAKPILEKKAEEWRNFNVK